MATKPEPTFGRVLITERGYQIAKITIIASSTKFDKDVVRQTINLFQADSVASLRLTTGQTQLLFVD